MRFGLQLWPLDFYAVRFTDMTIMICYTVRCTDVTIWFVILSGLHMAIWFSYNQVSQMSCHHLISQLWPFNFHTYTVRFHSCHVTIWFHICDLLIFIHIQSGFTVVTISFSLYTIRFHSCDHLIFIQSSFTAVTICPFSHNQVSQQVPLVTSAYGIWIGTKRVTVH